MKLFHNFNAKYLFDLSRNYTVKRSLIRLYRYLRTVAKQAINHPIATTRLRLFPRIAFELLLYNVIGTMALLGWKQDCFTAIRKYATIQTVVNVRFFRHGNTVDQR